MTFFVYLFNRAIITTIRGVIVIPEYHSPVAKKKFLKFFIEMLGHQNLEISCNVPFIPSLYFRNSIIANSSCSFIVRNLLGSYF